MCRITFTINGKIYHRERENNYFSLRETFKLVIIVNADFAISLVLTQMYVGTSIQTYESFYTYLSAHRTKSLR